MLTYQDFLSLIEGEEKQKAVYKVVEDYKRSEQYLSAVIGTKYARGESPTMENLTKMIYTVTGGAVPDPRSNNYKYTSGFFKLFITQLASYLLKNGVTFQHESTKTALGKKFETNLYIYTINALAQGVSYGFFNHNRVDFFKATEFAPLLDEETGQLSAGVYFWQIDENKPLVSTLYELDGYTSYKKMQDKITEIEPKRSYRQKVVVTKKDGRQVYNGDNYNRLPIVPLWANLEKQSELKGRRDGLDQYDIIKSGFASDLEEMTQIYWLINNYGGMSKEELAEWKQNVRMLNIVTSEGDGSVEAKTVEVPHESREVYLTRTEKDLYRDFMALNTENIVGGSVTATQINAAYEALDQRSLELQICLTQFIDNILDIAGIEDTAVFNPYRIANELENTQMVISASNYLDRETVLRKLPFITDKEIASILDRLDTEEQARYKLEQAGEPLEDIEDIGTADTVQPELE